MFSLLLQEHELVLLTIALSGTLLPCSSPTVHVLQQHVTNEICSAVIKTMSPKVISQCRFPLQHSCSFSWLRRSKKKFSIAFTVQVMGCLEKQQHQTKSGAGDKLDSKETVRDLCPTQETGASQPGYSYQELQTPFISVPACKASCAGKAGALDILAWRMASLAPPTCFSPRQLTSTSSYLGTPNPQLAGTIHAGSNKKTYFWSVILKTAIAGVTQNFFLASAVKTLFISLGPMTKRLRLTLPAVTATRAWCILGYYNTGQQSHIRTFCPVGVSLEWEMRERSVFRMILKQRNELKKFVGGSGVWRTLGGT